MFKSKKFIVLASVLACVILFGAMAGAVFAQGSPGRVDQGQAFLARVAGILGIDEQKLTSAFEQARSELRAQNQTEQKPERQNMDQMLEKLVQNGKITQEQASEIKAWWAAKPANPKDDPEAFKKWMDSRPDAPMGQGFRGPRLPGRNFLPGLVPGPKPTS